MDLIGKAVAVTVVIGLVFVFVALIVEVLGRARHPGARANRRR